jgi:PPM family protein phosphatase
MKIRPGLEIASLTDIGCQRESNEDSYGYWEPEDDSVFNLLGRLAIVADGMGGHEGGQIASHLAVETIQQIYYSSGESDPQQRLLVAFREAHHRIQQQALHNPTLRGMGTTCTSFAVLGLLLYYAHVGDSHLYLLRGGELRLLTRDHSLVARLLETGIIRADEAENHPQKHVLTAALGVADEIEPDFPDAPLQLEKADVLLICSDGLWGQMNETELKEVLAKQSPQEACRTLMQLAKDRGGPDNITLQIARMA